MQGEIRKGVTIEDGVWLGTRVIILDGVTVGKNSIVAAGSIVNKDVPPYTIVGGIPAKIIKNRKEKKISLIKMKKKIYIAGCGGMLGEAFYIQFKDDYEIKCTDKDVNEEWLSFMDFRDFNAYKKMFWISNLITCFILVHIPIWSSVSRMQTKHI